MNGTTLAGVLIGLSLVSLAFLFFGEGLVALTPSSTIRFEDLSLSATTLSPGEELRVQGILNGSSLEKIIYRSSHSVQEVECNLEMECRFSFTDHFTQNQVESIEISAENAYGDTVIEKRVITVLGTAPSCLDGTVFNACSPNTPLFCDNGTLLSRCATCGCAINEYCTPGGSCSGKGESLLPVGISFSPSSPVRPGITITPTVTLKFSAAVQQHASFIIQLNYLSDGGILIRQQEQSYIVPSTVESGEQVTIPFPSLSFPQNFFLNPEVVVQGVVDAEGTLSPPLSRLFDHALLVSNDSVPPAPPTSLTATYTEGILLQWLPSPSSDVAGYVIYESNEANSAFVSYTERTRVNAEARAYLIPDPAPGVNFYVISALDELGNESGFSNVAEFDLE